MQEAKTHDMIPKQQSPAYLFALIVLSISVAEAFVMLLLRFVSREEQELYERLRAIGGKQGWNFKKMWK